MRIIPLIIACICAAIATSLLVTVLVSTGGFGLQYANSQTLEYHFIVNDTIGIDLATDKLRLGQVVPGNGARRSIFLDGSPGDVYEFRTEGPGSEYLSFTPSRVEFSNETQEVEVRVQTPSSAETGVYEGIIYIVRQ